MKKGISTNAPYHASQFNRKNHELMGLAIGRVLNSTGVDYIAPSVVLSGRGTLDPFNGKLRRLTDSTAPGFDAFTQSGMWVIIGGESIMPGVSDVKDRKKSRNGLVNVALPQNFGDLSNPFKSTDVNKWILIRKGGNQGLFPITGFVDAGNIQVGGASFGTESNIGYSLIDPKDNYGIYDEFSAPSSTELVISESRPFPSQFRHEDIPYSVTEPAKISLGRGVFSQAGVHFTSDAPINVPIPASLMSRSGSVLYLCMEMLDPREEIAPRFFVSLSAVHLRNVCVIASSRMDLFGQFSTWKLVDDISLDGIRETVGRISHALPNGWTGKRPEYSLSYETYPPRLTVSSPDIGLDGKVKTGAVILAGDIVKDNSPELSTLLDVPFYPPTTGERIDRVVVIPRKKSDGFLDDLEGVASSSDPLGESTLMYQVGTSRNSRKVVISNEGVRMNPGNPDGGIIAPGSNSDTCVVRSNHFGSVAMIYADASAFAQAGISIQGLTEGDITGAVLKQGPKGDGARNIQCDVDGRGFFHLMWQETIAGTETLWYMRLDQYAVAPHGTGSLVLSGSIQDYRMTCTEDGKIFTAYRDLAGILSKALFIADKDSLVEFLVAPVSTGIRIESHYDTCADWRNDRYFIAYIEDLVSEPSLSVLSDSTVEFHNRQIPAAADGGALIVPGSLRNFRIERSNTGELILFCRGVAKTNDLNQYELLTQEVSGSPTVFTRCLPVPYLSDIEIQDVSSTDDGRFIVTGNIGTKAFLVSVSSSMGSLSTRIDFMQRPGSSIQTSSTHVTPFGDVIALSVHDDGINKNIEFFIASVDNPGVLPLHREGVQLSKDRQDGAIVVAEIVVPSGSRVARPMYGGYIASDVTPTGPASNMDLSLPESEYLVDLSIGNHFIGSSGVSFGFLSTADLVYAIMVMDEERSDGFNSSIDIGSIMSLYGSSDNDSWLEYQIEEIYRIDGRSYIVPSFPVSEKYIKIHLSSDVSVPDADAYHSDASPWKIAEIRGMNNKASLYSYLPAGQGDSGLSREPVVHHKGNYMTIPLSVGDGVNSSGQFSGWDGIQQALYASLRPKSSMSKGLLDVSPSVDIVVGKGQYVLKSPLVIPGGVSIRLMPGANIIDLYSSGDSRSILCNGYENVSLQVRGKTRTLQLPQSIVYNGISEGSLVEIDDGFTTISSRVVRVDTTGRIVHIDKVVQSSGFADVKLYALPVKIDGWSCTSKRQRSSSYSTGWNYEFALVESVILRQFKLEDSTGPGPEITRLMRILRCGSVSLEKVELSGPFSNEGLRIQECRSVSGEAVKVHGGSGIGTVLKDNLLTRGISGLTSFGDGLVPGSDLVIDGSLDGSPVGRMNTRLGGTGLSLLNSPNIGFDEFINMHVHRKGNVSILNGGVYEMLIALLSSTIQSYHPSAPLNLSIGVIDGLVTNSIIDASISS